MGYGLKKAKCIKRWEGGKRDRMCKGWESEKSGSEKDEEEGTVIGNGVKCLSRSLYTAVPKLKIIIRGSGCLGKDGTMG